MRKKKRSQETTSLRSSSLRRDSVSVATTTASHQTTQHVSVGCMSGIFHFMSKYHSRRKFLTFGRKQEREAPSPLPPPPPPPPRKTHNVENEPATMHEQGSSARLSLEVPRSPAIAAEIRRSSFDSSNSPRVIARLMGLEDIPETPPAPKPVTVDSTAEKRRRLLGALEKCDEDLQALKHIIEAVGGTRVSPITPPRVVRAKEEKEEEELLGSDEPSPVSVLDCHQLLNRSVKSSNYYKRTREGQMLQQQQLQQRQQHITARKKPGEEDNASFFFHYKPCATPPVVTVPPQSLYIPARNRLHFYTTTTTSVSVPWSRAMQESVIEVCRDVEWGQRREVGCIALLIEDIIYRNLIDEITRELENIHLCCASARSLLYEPCKRKLCL